MDEIGRAVDNAMGAYFDGEKREKIQRFLRLNKFCKKGQIVFAGSSLMEQFPIYEFIQDFNIPLTIYDRGVGGYTTAELAEHLDECIFQLEPSRLFLNIGTNDLGDPDYDEEELIRRYREILGRIRERLPAVRIYLLAYYPGNPKAAPNPYLADVLSRRTNERISSANRAVERLARELGAVWLDLNAGITDGDGCLKAEYTIDGIHMYADGYRAVLESLLPVLLERQA